MKLNSMNKLLSVILCIVLIAAFALFAAGCTGGESETPSTSETGSGTNTDATVMGEGEKSFLFTVVDADGNETAYEIHTDAATVGEALLALELIVGEESEYGLYVKSVNGTTLDYDTDGMYWAFYIDGEYALTGVDVTEITEGLTYTFQAEKA